MAILMSIDRFEVKPMLYSEEYGDGQLVTHTGGKPDLEILARGLHSDVNAQLEQWLHEQRQVTKEAILAFLQDLPAPQTEPHNG